MILAFALSFAVLMGFRMWTSSRYPQGPSERLSQAPPAESKIATPPATVVAPSPAEKSAKNPVPASVPTISGEERRVEIITKESEIAFSTKGARLLSWKLTDYKDARGRAVEIHPGGNPVPGPLDIITGQPAIDARLREAQFKATENGGSEPATLFEFADGTLEATKTIQAIKGGRAFRLQATVKEGGKPLAARVIWGPGLGQATEDEKSLRGYLPPQVVEIDEANQEIRLAPAALKEPRPFRAKVVGVENRYFAAILNTESGDLIEGTATVTEGKDMNVNVLASPPLVLTVGAKDYDRLKAAGLGAEKVVPVGSWLGPIVVPLTRALRAVNARVGNYGLAIVLLTLGIALAMAPLRHASIVSSAKMAKVAPQIRAVQERYKRLSLTDPKRQQMQTEIAEVYEKNGIDMMKQTALGCLPTLLTLPFFFAFYRMLDISVDLKGASFLWIPDLSLKDPLFITPVLSGLAMIAMQRLMPAPAIDPAQQRMMMMMPILFAGLFAWAPAGLNLYQFVSTVSSIGQQALAMYFAPHLFPRVRPAP